MRISMPQRDVAPAAGLDVWRQTARLEALEKRQKGEHAAAVEAWRRILDYRHDDSETAFEMAEDLSKAGRSDESIRSYRRAIQFGFDKTRAQLGLGQVLIGKRDFADACVLFEDIRAREPENIAAIVGLASAMRGAGRNEDARALLEPVRAKHPDDTLLLVELGRVLTELKRADDAIGHLKHASDLKKGDRDILMALAKALSAAQRRDDAVGALRSIPGRPDDAEFHRQLGRALLDQGSLSEAVVELRRTLALEPASQATYETLGLALFDLNRIDEGIAACDMALAIDPRSAAAQFNRGCMYLAQGRFTEGWLGYEYRFGLGDSKAVRTDVLAKPWMGEDLAGKSVLVVGEQASGDYIQFSRYVAALRERCAKLEFFVPVRLGRLLQGVASDVDIIWVLDLKRRYDVQVHLMSLPGIFHRLGWPIPPAPYLKAEPARVEHWSAKIGSEGFRIAIAWQGNAGHDRRDRRGFPLAALAPVARIPGVRFISLQIGDGEEQITALRDFAVETLGPTFDRGEHAFLDAAAVMQSVDLVICCDTSLAHLAGALGRPTLLVLNESPEWRWQRNADTTPWYSTVSLFRQKSRNDWAETFDRVAAAVRQHVAGSMPAASPPALPPAGGVPNVKVSWGECVDKATILQIKSERLTAQAALANVAAELRVLSDALAKIPGNARELNDLRGALYQVNCQLWDVEDQIRLKEAKSDFGDGFVELARSVYKLNDRRAALKRQINALTQSELVEEKQYA